VSGEGPGSQHPGYESTDGDHAVERAVGENARTARRVFERVLDGLLEAFPEQATELGDHRFDERLNDLSDAGIAVRTATLNGALSALDELDEAGLDVADRVDLEILRTQVARDLFLDTEIRPHHNDPLLHLPGDALYPLLAREVGEPADRLRSLTARMTAVPDRLRVARETLRDMPRVHVETAIGQVGGILALLRTELEALAEREPGLADGALRARQPAAEALEEHARWLEAQLPVSDGDARLGEAAFAAKLWYTLDTEISPDSLLSRAESDLQAVEEEIAELASRIAGTPPATGQVREVLDRMAATAPVEAPAIVPLCEQALADLTKRVRDLDVVSVPDDPVQVIAMPEARRGVAVAYCDAPGPLEPQPAGAPLPTFFAVSPPPADWSPELLASFYREYNGHMLRNLTVHEAMPGHVLQLAHDKRFAGSTRVRAAGRSGAFVEGWAVYAESLLARYGLGLGAEVDDGLRMQRLKVLLRTTINAVLDVRVHTRGMTEAEAMALMTQRGHQEEGEAAGKWRRAQLTSTQLSTYYVGYHEVCGVSEALRVQRPQLSERERHDHVLAHGSPPPRHLRTLLGLEAGTGSAR
jgi:uncharacterized protein (DUF885 family)